MAKKKNDNQYTGIAAYAREYGISEANKISSKSKVKYRETLARLNQSGDFKVVDVIDNHAEPDKSQSCVCQVKSCGRRIRYEFIIENNSHERLVCGSSCIKTLTNFENWKISELLKIPAELKMREEHEHKYEDWKGSTVFINGNEIPIAKIISKLERLSKTNLPIFELLNEAANVNHSILEEDDIRFIWFTNINQAFTNAKILKKVDTLLERAIKYNNDKGLIKRMGIYKDKLSINTALSKEQEEYVMNYRYDERPYGSCPVCAGKLVKRTGVYGEFIGCENYKLLKCDFTRDI